MNKPRDSVYIHLDYGRDPKTWAERHQSGLAWEPTPYGYGRAASHFDLTWSKDHRESSVFRLIRKVLTKGVGFDLVHAWRNRKALDTCDVVWTHTEREHLALRAIERMTRRQPKPMIAQSVWLWDRWSKMSPPVRVLTRRLLAGPSIHTTHSRDNAQLAIEVLVGSPVVVVPYGIEEPRTSNGGLPGQADANYELLAPGNDRHRDWSTLASATSHTGGRNLWIVTPRVIRASIRRVIPHAKIGPTKGVADMQAAYEACSVVVVPLKQNMHASGATVGLEALSFGKALVVGDTGGVRDYFGDHAIYYELGDSASLRSAIEIARKAGPVEADFGTLEARGLTAKDFVDRHIALSNHLLSKPVDLKGVSDFRPFRAPLSGRS